MADPRRIAGTWAELLDGLDSRIARTWALVRRQLALQHPMEHTVRVTIFVPLADRLHKAALIAVRRETPWLDLRRELRRVARVFPHGSGTFRIDFSVGGVRLQRVDARVRVGCVHSSITPVER